MGVYNMCPPAVRLAALEAFVRICFTQHAIVTDFMRRSLKSESAKPMFLPAAFEAVAIVAQQDCNRRIRRGAARLLLEVLQHAPPGRQAYAALRHEH